MFDAVIYIGRFQPLHKGHIETINRAFNYSNKVYVLVGSSHRPRSIKNPFTFDERKAMIQDEVNNPGLVIQPLNDYLYNDAKWITQIKNIVGDGNIAIIGLDKDHSSYYLNELPYTLIEMDHFLELNSTGIRHSIYNDEEPIGISDKTLARINEIDLSTVKDDYRYIIKYRAEYANLKFPPIFVTTGCLVRVGNEVLVIERGRDIGVGLYALPGGFLDSADKSILSGALRELEEEAGISGIESSLVGTKIFDQLDRSHRGRMITHVYYFVLDKKPDVIAGDDAKSVVWLDIESIESTKCYSDLLDAIDEFLDIL